MRAEIESIEEFALRKISLMLTRQIVLDKLGEHLSKKIESLGWMKGSAPFTGLLELGASYAYGYDIVSNSVKYIDDDNLSENSYFLIKIKHPEEENTDAISIYVPSDDEVHEVSRTIDRYIEIIKNDEIIRRVSEDLSDIENELDKIDDYINTLTL